MSWTVREMRVENRAEFSIGERDRVLRTWLDTGLIDL